MCINHPDATPGTPTAEITMLAQHTIDRIEQFWASHFGCSTAVLRGPGITVLPNPRNMIWVFRYQDACLWHVPQKMVPAFTAALRGPQSAEQVFSEEFIRATVGPALARMLGPCPIACCDAQTFHRGHISPNCRQLGPADSAAIDRLAQACGPEAWEHGGVDPATHPGVFGYFEDGRLCAASSYETWGGTLAHVGLVTAPDVRGRGLGKIVATAATAHALERGLVPQWRTLASNLPSLAVGRALGYQPVAAHFFVGLAPM
jgi:GNAT superfamily N-acetyltransferase